MDLAFQSRTIRKLTKAMSEVIEDLEETREAVKTFHRYAVSEAKTSPKSVGIVRQGDQEIRLRADLDFRGNSQAYIDECILDLRNRLGPKLAVVPPLLDAQFRKALSTAVLLPESEWLQPAIDSITDLRDNLSSLLRQLEFQSQETENFMHSELHFIAPGLYASKNFRVVLKNGARYLLTLERAKIIELLCKAYLSKQLDVPIEELLVRSHGVNNKFHTRIDKAFEGKGKTAFLDLIELTGGARGRMARLKVGA